VKKCRYTCRYTYQTDKLDSLLLKNQCIAYTKSPVLPCACTLIEVSDSNHPGTLTLRAGHQSARMSKITNDDLTRSSTGCFIAVPIWQQWASKG